MSIEQMRAKISWAYPGDKWLDKVMAMPDVQVHSVYMRLKNSGKLDMVPDSYGVRTV